MFHLTQHAALQAAFISNLLYGAIMLLAARACGTSVEPDDMPWIMATGAAGHLLHALTAPGADLGGGRARSGVALDIALVFGSVWMLLVSLPELGWALDGHMDALLRAF